MVSGEPKISSMEIPSTPFTSDVHSTSLGPRIVMRQIGPGFGCPGNSEPVCHRTLPQTFKLGEDEPHPVPLFAALLQLTAHLRVDRVLSFDESFQVKLHISRPS